MPITHPGLPLARLPSAWPAGRGVIGQHALLPICQNVRDGGGRLVALWGSDERAQNGGYALHVVLVNESGLVCLTLPLPAEQPAYEDISRSEEHPSELQ